MADPEIFLPTAKTADVPFSEAAIDAGQKISTYLTERAQEIHQWLGAASARPGKTNPSAESLLAVFLHKRFNYLARGYLTAHKPGILAWIREHLSQNSPLNCFLLYNGGYRASPSPDNRGLTFQPDQTEFMLLLQVALLHDKVANKYPPGIRFTIVINNGVALWTNEIPLSSTELYVSRLRGMIKLLGASDRIQVLVQSELPGFSIDFPRNSITPLEAIDDENHFIIERFLNRDCSREEALYRAALYLESEARWARDLQPVAEAESALLMRQVAHPETLNFRPFPGGAIRVQNGKLGFQNGQSHLIPILVTSKSHRHNVISPVPCEFPFPVEEAGIS